MTALGAAAILAALPQSAQSSWSPAFAAVLCAPLRPVTGLAAWVRDRVSPPEEPYARLPEELRAALEERDRLRGELDATALRAAALERELGELSGFRPAIQAGWRPRLATVVERSAGRPPGLLAIDIGSDHGVQAGDPVVVGGNQLLGRIAASGSASRSLVIPLDDRRAGRIDAQIRPAGGAGRPNAGAPGAPGPAPPAVSGAPAASVAVQLVPQGGRLLSGELEQGTDIRLGDPVLLDDATWRPAAQGMRVGVVDSVGPLDSNPLRRRISVRMETDPSRISRVVVKVRDAGTAGGRR